MRRLLTQLALTVYKVFVSPLLHLLSGWGLGCRFHPTCSVYMAQSIQIHGPFRGSYLGLRRILRCHPFSSTPFHDPVIEKANWK